MNKSDFHEANMQVYNGHVLGSGLNPQTWALNV